jgi:hypothetical protein
VLIVDRNAGFAGLLRTMATGLDITALQSGAGVAVALAGARPMVGMVDLETPHAQTALAVLREERIPAVLVSEEHAHDSEEIVGMVKHFGVARFVEKPFPILDIEDVLREVASRPAPEAEISSPVAPWARDPVSWHDLTEEPAQPRRPAVSHPPTPAAKAPAPDHDAAPRAPWDTDPDSWVDEAPRHSAQAAPVTRYGKAEPPSTPAVQSRSDSLVPPWERKPDRWTELEKPVAPWDEAPGAWEEEREKLVHTDLERVNTRTLRRLVTLWVRRRSGILTCDELRGSAAFADGGPLDKSAEGYVMDLLQQPTARIQFQDGTRAPNVAREAFGALLFRAALDLIGKDWVEGHAAMALQPVAHLDELRELPIGLSVSRILESADGILPLLEHLTGLDVRLDDVDSALAALDKLGLLDLTDVSVNHARRRSRKSWVRGGAYEGSDRRKDERRVGPERRRNRDRRRDRRKSKDYVEAGDDARTGDRRDGDRRLGDRRVAEAAAPAAPEKKRSERPKKKKRRPALGQSIHMPTPAQMHTLLEREWGMLQDANAWKVLGLPNTESREAVVKTGRRMLERYEPVMADPKYDLGTQKLAQNVSERVRWAMKNARPVAANVGNSTRDGLIFDEGMRAMLSKDWETAVKCFKTAHKLAVEDPRYMGYYGWSLWHLAESMGGKDKTKKRKTAEEFLRLSDSLDNEITPIQIFLATIELELGDINRSVRRRARLRERGEVAGEVDLLSIAVQKAEAKAAEDKGPERT